jgi:signal peptide peptidase SppA
MVVQDGVATIDVRGVLMKQRPGWMEFLGVESTEYSEVVADAEAAIADASVREIVLAVSSPGGQVAGVVEATEALEKAGRQKRMTARVDDLCASGAYWLAAQAAEISAGPNDIVGSIGVYSVYYDSSKFVQDMGFKAHLVSSGSHKGMGAMGVEIKPEQLAAMQEVINGMAENFKAAVVRGRKRSAETVASWATGRVWGAAQARDLGLIDRVATNSGKTPAGGVRPAAESKESEKGDSMAEENGKTAAADEKLRTQAVEEGRRAERDRVASIRAAFPKHPQFAMTEIDKGSTLLEAKAAYGEFLSVENARMATENESLKAAQTGTEAVPHGQPSSEVPKPDFMAMARVRAGERKISLFAAQREIAAEQPALHAEYLEFCAEQRDRVRERKAKLGMK